MAAASRIRDLCGVIEQDVAAIGVFLTLTPPTRPMIAEAAAGPFEEAGLDSVPASGSSPSNRR